MRQLLQQHKFLAYFSTQFLGALNDNFFKNALTLNIIFEAQNNSQENSLILINIAAALFILPFLLFSPLAGAFTQASEKSRYIQRLKALEVLLMSLAALFFLFNQTYALLALLFLMGSQSAFFGPVKYSIIALMLPKKDWYQANALVEAATFIAILIGLFLSSFLMQSQHADVYFGLGLVLFSIIGYVSAKQIPTIDAAQTQGLHVQINALTSLKQQIKLVKQQQLVAVVFAISYFWFFGAIYLTQLPAYVKYHLQANSSVYSLLLIIFALGIGLGSLSSRWFTHTRSLKQVSRMGLFGLIVFGMIFSAFPASNQTALINLTTFVSQFSNQLLCLSVLAIGISGGFFIVPLYTLMQMQSNDANRSHIIAANNLLNALLMICSAIFALLLLQTGTSLSGLFFILSLLSIGVLLLLKNISGVHH